MRRKDRDPDRPSRIALLNEITQAYKDLFASPSGKRVLEDLEKRYSVSTFHIKTSEKIDPFKTHLDLGKLMVFGYIKNQIDRELLEENEND